MTIYQSYEEAIEAGAKATDLVREKCRRCVGHGNIGYGHVNSTHYQTGAQIGSCFDCLGRGTTTVRVSSIKARLRREAKRADEAAKAQAEADAKVAARQAWDAAHPDEVALIAELADTVREQGLAFDLLNSKVNIPTDAQIAKLHEIKAQREEREAARRPVITGKAIQIEGEVVSVKVHETYFGHRTQYTTKIVVRDDRGFKVWGTLPSELAAELHLAFLDAKEAEGYSKYDFGPDCWLESVKGRRIRFTANIEASDRDDSFDFGFFKRPRKAERA